MSRDQGKRLTLNLYKIGCNQQRNEGAAPLGVDCHTEGHKLADEDCAVKQDQTQSHQSVRHQLYSMPPAPTSSLIPPDQCLNAAAVGPCAGQHAACECAMISSR